MAEKNQSDQIRQIRMIANAMAQGITAMMFVAEPESWPVYERWVVGKLSDVEVPGVSSDQIRTAVRMRTSRESMITAISRIQSGLAELSEMLGSDMIPVSDLVRIAESSDGTAEEMAGTTRRKENQ